MAVKTCNFFDENGLLRERGWLPGAVSRRRFLTMASQGAVALALYPHFARADSVAYLKKTLLYVGIGAKNNGVASPLQNHMNDTTTAFGYTIDYASAMPADRFVEVFAGVGAHNMGVASRDTNYLNDATQSIGMLSLDPVFPDARKLYVGTGARNNGVVTPNQMHLNDTTAFFGYALPP